MLDHGRIHQGHEKEIRDVSTFTAQHVDAARRSIWRDVTLTLRKHVGAARRSVWRDVTLTLRKNQPSRFKHVTSIICYLCFMQYAWRCVFFKLILFSWPAETSRLFGGIFFLRLMIEIFPILKMQEAVSLKISQKFISGYVLSHPAR